MTRAETPERSGDGVKGPAGAQAQTMQGISACVFLFAGASEGGGEDSPQESDVILFKKSYTVLSLIGGNLLICEASSSLVSSVKSFLSPVPKSVGWSLFLGTCGAFCTFLRT